MPKSKKVTTRKKLVKGRRPFKSENIFVTKKMLDETKYELKRDITSLKLAFEARFSTVESKLETILAAVHRSNALNEEQASRNRVVLDGYDQLYRKQEDFEKRLSRLEKQT